MGARRAVDEEGDGEKGSKTSHLKRSSTVDSEVIRTLAMEKLSGGRHNVLYVVNREESVEEGGKPP